MNYDTLKSELKENKFKNLYLLYGDEDYLKNALLGKMQSMAGANDPDTEIIKFGKGFTASELSLALNTMSFFGGGKFIICSDTGIFKGKGKHEDIESVIGSIPEGSHVIFIESAVDRANPLFAEMSKAGFAYKVDMRKAGDLARYINGKFRKHKKKISSENISLFIEYSGTNLMDIEADIEKVLLYMGSEGTVKGEYIANLCSGTRQYRIYEMTDRIFSRDTAGSMKLLEDLLADKTPVQVMLVTIHNRLMELAALREAVDKGRDAVVYRNGRPLADFIIRRMQRQAANYTLNGLRDLILLAAETDMDIKSGKIGDVTGIEVLVNSLCTI